MLTQDARRLSFCRIVYCLLDPCFDDQIRYVGETSDYERRMTRHFLESEHLPPSFKNLWLLILRHNGLRPIMRPLTRIEPADPRYTKKIACRVEMEWAKRLILDHPLLNAPYFVNEHLKSGIDMATIDEFRYALWTALPNGPRPGRSRSRMKNADKVRRICDKYPALIFWDFSLAIC